MRRVGQLAGKVAAAVDQEAEEMGGHPPEALET